MIGFHSPYISPSQQRCKIHQSKNLESFRNLCLLISFKRDKTIGNFLVRKAFQTTDQPGTYKRARARCKTCPFLRNPEKISGPKRSIKIPDHFTCTSANIICCITYTLCKKVDIETVNVVPRSTRNTNSGTRELTLKCKLKCYP